MNFQPKPKTQTNVQRKLQIKSQTQILKLKHYYHHNPKQWKNQQINKLSSQLNLTRSQVYKYLWNLKKKSQQTKNFQQSQSPFSLNRKKEYNKLILQDNIVAKIPKKLEFAQIIYVPQNISPWVQKKLTKNGCQIINYQIN